MITPTELTSFVNAVKQHAQANYNVDGWDIIVEAFEDAELAETLVEWDRDVAPVYNANDAIKVFAGIADGANEQRLAADSLWSW